FRLGFLALAGARGSPHAPHHAQKRRAMGNPARSPSTSLRARPLRSLGKSRMTAQRNNEGFVEALAAMVNPIKTVTLIHRGENNRMARKIIYWVSTGLVAALGAFAAFTYLSGSPQAVEGFSHV